MARYHLTAKHFIDGRLYEAGDEIEFSRSPTPDMTPLDDEASSSLASMPWAGRGWRLEMTRESLPGGRHSDGSPVLLNRPANFGAPLTNNPPQPDLTKEVPFGCRSYRIKPRQPRESYWGVRLPLRPYALEC